MWKGDKKIPSISRRDLCSARHTTTQISSYFEFRLKSTIPAGARRRFPSRTGTSPPPCHFLRLRLHGCGSIVSFESHNRHWRRGRRLTTKHRGRHSGICWRPAPAETGCNALHKEIEDELIWKCPGTPGHFVYLGRSPRKLISRRTRVHCPGRVPDNSLLRMMINPVDPCKPV